MTLLSQKAAENMDLIEHHLDTAAANSTIWAERIQFTTGLMQGYLPGYWQNQGCKSETSMSKQPAKSKDECLFS